MNIFQVIHCIRNPKDVLSSSVPFFNKMGLLADSNWDNYFQSYISGHGMYVII